MPLVPRPYDLVQGIRDSAEAQRWQSVQQAIQGAISARSITADMIAVGTITATEIAAGAITATEIAAGAITASKINVSALSAITANLGTVNAGTINGVTVQLGTGTPRVEGDNTGIRAIGNKASYRFFNATESDRIGAARSNHYTTDTGPDSGALNVEIELVAYRGYAPSRWTASSIRCRDADTDNNMADVTTRADGSSDTWGGDSGVATTINDGDGKMVAISFDAVSGRRVKKDIRSLGGGQLGTLEKLKPSVYRRKIGKGEEEIGLIAEEVREHLPHVVTEHRQRDKDGNDVDPVLCLSPMGILTVAVGAIQELAARVEQLEKG